MANQTTLFDIGESDALRHSTERKGNRKPNSPSPPGSGPPGETCGTCTFMRRYHNHSGKKRWCKCGIMMDAGLVGGSSATDVKVRQEACKDWTEDRDLFGFVPEEILKEPNCQPVAADWLEEYGGPDRQQDVATIRWKIKNNTLCDVDSGDTPDDPSAGQNKAGDGPPF